MTRRKLPQRIRKATIAAVKVIDDDDDALIGARKARQLLHNCSEMHIWRLLNLAAYAALKFPKPIKINTRNYWKRCDILKWIERQANVSRSATLSRRKV